METTELKWIDGLPVCHEPNEPANCASTANAINSIIALDDCISHAIFQERMATNIVVLVIDDDDACLPIGVRGIINGVNWRATLCSKPPCERMNVDGKSVLVWRPCYEVERRD